jgi:hypothetical protein
MDEFFTFFDVEEIPLPASEPPVAGNQEKTAEAAKKAAPPADKVSNGVKRKANGPLEPALKRTGKPIKEAAAGSEKKLGTVKQAVHQVVKQAVQQVANKGESSRQRLNKPKVVQETHIWIPATCDVIYVHEPLY